ncbi:histidine phosphatase family protein [Nakamurella sp. PAMC28650]|uniref:histidine phosphatase family protein n=1 Tax=Nakamurella sp. PAMC28650 TaxID=2762325 RepID=UPI00164D8183|nr:histidine phosphatase family protein [Nakamurella sp. PAMC28650]QNK80725.1 histidine phosphatase family protein [Nakamurella sp. PAMC28650]
MTADRPDQGTPAPAAPALPATPAFPAAPAAAAVHLVRHGQSTWNVQGRVQGQNDGAELTPLGRQQAAAVAQLLLGFDATRLLTSDLRRAVQTAEIIGAATGLTPIESSLLREQGLGILEGMDSAQAALEWEAAAQRALQQYGEPVPATSIRLPGGESMRDVLGRVGGILASPWITDAAGDVVIVSHGDTIRIMLALLLGDDFDVLDWRPVESGEVHSIHRTPSGAVEHVVTAIGFVG